MSTKNLKIAYALVAISTMLTGLVVLPVQKAEAALVPGGAVGPIVATGIGRSLPAWYMDQNGLGLEIMEAADPFGISAPVEVGNAFSAELGFADEGFYWAADAAPANPHGVGSAVLAMEAAFLGGTVDGGGAVFGRIRFRFDVGEPGTYTIRHPFGNNTYDVLTVGPGPEINDTSDIGCFPTVGVLSCNPNTPPGNPNNYSLALQSGIGPFLTWNTFNLNPALTDPALINAANPTKRYVGNPNIPHAITGSPVGQNFIRIEGPNIGGVGINFIQENLFTVVGRLAVIDVTPPVIGATTPASVAVGATNIPFNANISDDIGVRNVTADLGALGNTFTASLSGAQEVPASPSLATGSGSFTINTTANTLTINNLNATGLPVGDPVTGIHIHGTTTPPGGAAGQNAPDAFVVPGTTFPVAGVVWNYPEVMEAEILAGRTYVNIHTVLFPNGLIRGQILPTANVQPMVLTSGTATSGTWGVIIPSVSRAGVFNIPIVASDGSNSATLNATLTAAALTGVTVAPTAANVVIGATLPLVATPNVAATVTWSSSNNAIATVSPAGLVTGVATGTAVITASATDGITTVTGTSTITVVPPGADLVPPVITVLGANPTSVQIGGAYTDAGATALDDIDGNITARIVTTGLPINTAALGAFTVTYSVSDLGGNTVTATRTVNVVNDIVPPVITLVGGASVNVIAGAGAFADPGATALDNVDGDVTARITKAGAVDTNTLGAYPVVYTVSDLAGNTASTTRTVNVVSATGVVPAPATGGGAVSSGGGGGGGGGATGNAIIYFPSRPTPKPTPEAPSRENEPERGGQVLGAQGFQFARDLREGMRGDDVSKLQELLTKEGVYNGLVGGYFGPATKEGVRKYQQKYNITPANGNVGPLTRGKLNSSQVLGAQTTASKEAMRAVIAQLQAQVLELVKKLNEMLKAGKV